MLSGEGSRRPVQWDLQIVRHTAKKMAGECGLLHIRPVHVTGLYMSQARLAFTLQCLQLCFRVHLLTSQVLCSLPSTCPTTHASMQQQARLPGQHADKHQADSCLRTSVIMRLCLPAQLQRNSLANGSSHNAFVDCLTILSRSQIYLVTSAFIKHGPSSFWTRTQVLGASPHSVPYCMHHTDIIHTLATYFGHAYCSYRIRSPSLRHHTAAVVAGSLCCPGPVHIRTQQHGAPD
jgi:hypothetical protein